MLKTTKHSQKHRISRNLLTNLLLVPALALSFNPSVLAAEGGNKVEDFINDERAALSPEKYEELLLAMAVCEVGEYRIDSDCPQKKAFDEMRNRNTSLKDLVGLNASLGRKHINHESPAIRLWAAGMSSSVFGADAASQAVVLDAAKKEKHPAVLRAMLDAVGSKMGVNEDIYQFVLQSTEHPEPIIRIEAISSLTAWGEEMEGAFEKVFWVLENDKEAKVRNAAVGDLISRGKEKKGVLEKILWVIENDPDMGVRAFACERVAKMEDERALPVLEKLTANPETEADMNTACMQGAVDMFTGFMKPNKPSEKAYRLVLKRLSEGPYDKDRPSWKLMNDFEHLAKEKPQWVKLEEVVDALKKTAGNDKVAWMARSYAVNAMSKLGAPKNVFEELQKTYAGVPDDPGIRAIKESLEKALKQPD